MSISIRINVTVELAIIVLSVTAGSGVCEVVNWLLKRDFVHYTTRV